MKPEKIERMRRLLIEYKGCMRRTAIESGMSICSVRRYAKDILENRDKL